MSETALSATAVIGPDTPLRLEKAAQIAFPGGSMTASSLRREAKRGSLEIERIANKQFTTLRAIEKMRQLCREGPKEYVSGLNQKSETVMEGLYAVPRGSSETERVRSARAALEMTAKGLTERSPSTLPPDTKSPASGAVIHLKSSS